MKTKQTIFKRNFLFVFIISVLFWLIGGTLYAASLGDVNHDGLIDMIDSLLTAQYAVDIEIENFYTDTADVNADKIIDIVDALLIAQYTVGLITEFPGQIVTPTPIPTITPITDFVTRSGNRLIAKGKSFFFNGANQYYLFYKPKKMIDEVLEDAAELGLNCIRTWGFCDGDLKEGFCFQTAPGVFNEATFKQMDYIIYKAGSLGIRLILPLVNNGDDFGGMVKYIQWSPTASVHDEFYTDTWCKNTYKAYINYFLNRKNTISGILYKNDPVIMIWELANEPRCPSDKTGNTLQTWIDEMAAYIKSIDPIHLVSTGEEGLFNGGTGFLYDGSQGADFIRNHQGPNIDLCSIHLNPHDWNITRQQSADWLETHIMEAHNFINKPIYVGEFCWHIEDSGVPERNSVFTEWYQILDNFDADGANFWQLSGHQENGTLYPDYDGYTIYYPEHESTDLIIQTYSASVKTKSGL